MPRYLVLDGFCLGGSYGDAYPGDVVELAEKDARSHLSIGRLRPALDAPAAPAVPAASDEPPAPAGAPAAPTTEPAASPAGRRSRS